MFYIYTPEGRSFSGPLEKLRKVEPLPESARTRKVHREQTDTAADAGNGDTDGYAPSQSAVRQYDDMLNLGEEREPVVHAYQAMSQPVETIPANATLREAYELFQRHPYQVMPVLNDRRELVSTLSRHVFNSYLLSLARREDMNSQTVAEVFVREGQKVYTADPVTDIRRIAALLVEYRLDAVPVVQENGRLVGIVSRTDILTYVAKDPPLSLWC